MSRRYWSIAAIVLICCAWGCNSWKRKDPELDLGQNWGADDQRAFYHAPQGSQMIPYVWFLALERPNQPVPFAADSLQRFGYLKDPFPSTSEYNPDALPIGFVRDDDQTGAWIGMTCAACHTSEVIIGGKAHRIDGAPTDADFFAFIKELNEALMATANDPEALARFSRSVDEASRRLGIPSAAGDELATQLHATSYRFQDYFERSSPKSKDGTTPPIVWGNARLDAVQLIINEVAHNLVPIPSNVRSPDAPVSYPFLWDTHQQPRVQWNGVSNAALSRNTTEVLGVFARFDAASPSTNSVQLGNLRELEGMVVQLRSPRWEDSKYGLPPIGASAARGAELYKNLCQECHARLDRKKDQVADVPIKLMPLAEIGTDPAMAIDFSSRTIVTAEGAAAVSVQEGLAGLLPSIWIKSPTSLVVGAFETLIGTKIGDINVYKARPLDGIWATAPYLHNGSVPNLMELLKPSEERVKQFCVGSRELDTVNVGFESALGADGTCGDADLLDTSLPGNLNTGHEYGTIHDARVASGEIVPLTENDDRMALIEFIKSE